MPQLMLKKAQAIIFLGLMLSWIASIIHFIEYTMGIQMNLFPSRSPDFVTILFLVINASFLSAYCLYLGIKNLKSEETMTLNANNNQKLNQKKALVWLMCLLLLSSPLITYAYVYEQQSSNIFQTILNSASSSLRYAIAYSTYLNPNTMGSLKTVEIATDGTITDTIIDTLNFDSNWGEHPSAIHVSGDVYAIAYTGDSDYGLLKTVEIATDGSIYTVIDTLTFDTYYGGDPNIISISGDVYAIAYAGDRGDGFLKTVEIATNGQITDTVIDELEFDTKDALYSKILHISGNIYAIAYTSDGNDGNLKTVEIATNGQITDTVIDILEFDTVYVANPDIIPVSGNIYAITYCGLEYSYLKTVEIATNGQITDTVIDELEFFETMYEYFVIIHVSGDVYAIAYDTAIYGAGGYLKTVEIATDGQITDTVIDTMQFHNARARGIDIIHVSGDFYAIAYQGYFDDGYLNTVEIATDGQITDTVIDELVFDTESIKWPDIIQLSDD